MAGQHGKKQARQAGLGRRLLTGVGAGAGVIFAAAAMATGSAVTAAPAHADFEDLLDPIIQPLLTSFTDSIAAFDPSAAADITSWTDSLLSSLGNVDVATSGSDSALAAASSAAAEPAAVSTATLPVSIAEGTEPTVTATVGGESTTLLVDSGSSGLVVPLTSLDGGSTNFFTELETLYSLGTPTSFGEGGYSGGVEYYYLTYDAPVDYASTGGTVDTTVPIEVEVYSYNPSDLSSLFTNDAFQNFDTDNDVAGVLGIGTTGTGGAGESPIEEAGYSGATLNLNSAGTGGTLTLDTNPETTGLTQLTATGSNVSLTETVTTEADNTGATLGTGTVSDDIDSGGVYGTIPSSVYSETVPAGDYINVLNANGSVLYSYEVEAGEAPTTISGTSIDSGVLPFFGHTLSIDYSNGDLYYK